MTYMEWMRMRCELESLYRSGDLAGLADALHEWSETILAGQGPEIQQAYADPDERIPLGGHPGELRARIALLISSLLCIPLGDGHPPESAR